MLSKHRKFMHNHENNTNILTLNKQNNIIQTNEIGYIRRDKISKRILQYQILRRGQVYLRQQSPEY